MGVLKLHQNLDLKKVDIGSKQVFTIKDFLFFFDIATEDISKLIEFSSQIKKDKEFVLKHKNHFLSLTEREKEVFILVIQGKKSNEIADELFIETVTVSTHRKHIKQKLNLTSNYDWYRYAKAFDLIRF